MTASDELESWPRGEPVALHPRLQRLTLEVILRAVFGLDTGARLDSLRGLLTELLGAENYISRPAPIMGAEDFSYILQRMPGCMMFLGVQPDAHNGHGHVAPCHSNRKAIRRSMKDA